MAVTVTLIPTATGVINPSPVIHQNATMIDVDFDHLFVCTAPDVPVASYSKGSWLSAVVS